MIWKDGGDCGRAYREIVNEDEGHVIAKVRIKRYAFHRPAFTPTVPWPEGETNFRLILQALQMLEALEAIQKTARRIVGDMDIPTRTRSDWRLVERHATAAIAAAKGENDDGIN